MNIEERALVKEALRLMNGRSPNLDHDNIVIILNKALDVRKPLNVCEKCLKIGSCDCNVPKAHISKNKVTSYDRYMDRQWRSPD